MAVFAGAYRILDGPPPSVKDSAILSSFVEGTLLMIDAGRTHRRDVLRGREALGRVGANVLGLVLNRLPAESRADCGYDV